MTIKEVEARTGLVRANIRYYEDQGFFSAARGENGYRNYSDENVDTLLKIKLLRQLGFSLEELHALQNGEQSLDAALEKREEGLSQERQALDQAARLCREMRTEGADFYTLDARRYLDRMAREETVLLRDRDPVRVFPWRRFFARTLDMELYTALLTIILQLTCRINVVRMSGDGGTILMILAALVLMAGVETAMLHLWGTTPGKALLGLKILREDGSFLSWEEAARRTGLVIAFFGGGLLLAQVPIPICALVSLGMDIWACWQAYHEKPLFWEPDGQLYLDGSTRERTFWEERRNYLRIAGCLGAWVLCVGLMVGGHLLAARPPHRGPSLTAEEFVDNYNRYMAFVYGEENLSQRLTSSGAFEDIPRESGTVVIDLMKNDQLPDPCFSFGQEHGGLSTVTLTWSFDSVGTLGENQSYLISIPYREIYTALRALLWSRLGDKGVESVYNTLVEQEGNYHTSLDGIQIDSEMRFTGYSAFSDSALLAQTGRAQSIFVEFSIALTD